MLLWLLLLLSLSSPATPFHGCNSCKIQAASSDAAANHRHSGTVLLQILPPILIFPVAFYRNSRTIAHPQGVKGAGFYIIKFESNKVLQPVQHGGREGALMGGGPSGDTESGFHLLAWQWQGCGHDLRLQFCFFSELRQGARLPCQGLLSVTCILSERLHFRKC